MTCESAPCHDEFNERRCRRAPQAVCHRSATAALPVVCPSSTGKSELTSSSASARRSSRSKTAAPLVISMQAAAAPPRNEDKDQAEALLQLCECMVPVEAEGHAAHMHVPVKPSEGIRSRRGWTGSVGTERRNSGTLWRSTYTLPVGVQTSMSRKLKTPSQSVVIQGRLGAGST